MFIQERNGYAHKLVDQHEVICIDGALAWEMNPKAFPITQLIP